MFRKTDLEYPVFTHPALVLMKRDLGKNMKLQGHRLCESSRQIEKSQVSILDSVERTCVGPCNYFFVGSSWVFFFFANAREGPLLTFRV